MSSSDRTLVAHIDALQSLTHVLVRASNLSETYAVSLDGVMRLLEAPRAGILLFDTAGVLQAVASHGLSEASRRAFDGCTPWAPGACDPAPIIVADVRHAPELQSHLATLLAEGIEALAFVPLVGEGGVIGNLTVCYDRPRHLAPADLLLAQTVAQQVAFAVERRRIEQRLTMQNSLLEAQSEASTDGILVVAPSGQIVSFNARFVELWKIPPDVIARRSDDAAIGAVLDLLESPQAFVERVRYLYDHPEECSRDRLVLKDGRQIERYSAPVVSPDGIDFGRVWFFRDLTDQLRAEATLRAEHALRKAIEDSMLAGVAAFDAAGRQTYVNPAFCRMVGWPASELVGQTAPFKYWAPDEERTVESLLRTETNSCELRLRRSSGDIFDALMLVSPLQRGAGAADEWLTCVYDITARKRDERLLAELLEKEHAARAEAEAASRAKDEFIATLSHELRTPLNALLGWTQLLQRGELDAVGRGRALGAIQRNAQLQAQLISDILDMSRIIKGKLPLCLQLAPVRELVLDALESFQAVAAAKGLAFTSEVDPAVPAMVVDAARVSQVLWNLLSNAVKFTPEGGSIHVSAAIREGSLEIAVRDSGVGIPPDFLPHVFERYRQAEASVGRSHGGLGLGLAIVRNIVELHGGAVSASSGGSGMGSMFTVTFPVQMVGEK